MYGLKPPYNKRERLIHLYKGKRVNLTGEDVKQTIPESHKGPKHTVTIKGASQEVLKDLLENPDEHGNWEYMIQVIDQEDQGKE